MIHSYKANPDKSTAHFKLHNILIPDVEGDFECLRGKFIYDPENLKSSVIEAYIDVKTISTGKESRDSQFKGEEFFNAKKYPTIVFHSLKFEIQDDLLKVLGNLTVKHITKEVVLNVERPDNIHKRQMSLAASTIINRDEFGLALGRILEVGEVLVGDNIQITMDIQLTKE
ncbi:YceI family protein [Bacteriovorax sp. PP10]|uniref:YceI family protein n=1 Tax=Bacteriovorax antarcticus TaxID=3088717 RepID=A0ABU5VYM4_9BACT|nr:YceI family protein [Bacteriovorax sp. PP10]MEA9357419.1 YceI family protein [Bacteriovorax sp. PP10]